MINDRPTLGSAIGPKGGELAAPSPPSFFSWAEGREKNQTNALLRPTGTDWRLLLDAIKNGTGPDLPLEILFPEFNENFLHLKINADHHVHIVEMLVAVGRFMMAR